MKARKYSDPEFIEQVIAKCEVCYLAMVDPDGAPYVIPMNFGYEPGFVYFHSSGAGRKIAILENNPRACVTFSTDHALYIQNENVACSYGMKYKSVIASGTIEFITDYDQKVEALDRIMSQYAARSFHYNAPAVRNVKVFRMRIMEIMGKEFGHLK